jgi:uncharacterized membrane protein (DUF441 family)
MTSTTTVPQAPRRAGRLHPKRLSKMTAAIAALAGALSVVVGVLAARLAPHGLRGLAITLHITREPLIVKVAAGIGTIAVTTAAVSGILHFYLWWQERHLD